MVGILDQSPRHPGIEDALAITVASQNQTWGDPFCASVIFTGYIRFTLSESPYFWNDETINKAIDMIVIHELGHSRGGFPNHCPNNGNVPCVMVPGIANNQYQFLEWYDFCDDCKEVIEAVEWEENW